MAEVLDLMRDGAAMDQRHISMKVSRRLLAGTRETDWRFVEKSHRELESRVEYQIEQLK
jgi:hypothetical protein